MMSSISPRISSGSPPKKIIPRLESGDFFFIDSIERAIADFTVSSDISPPP
jgi:hypothetical protein